MPTDQVTQLHPLQHYASCDRETYGRAVMALLDLDCEITAARVRGWVARFRETASCDCLASRIKTAEDAVRLARAAFKACVSDASADRVERASAELSRLRGMA